MEGFLYLLLVLPLFSLFLGSSLRTQVFKGGLLVKKGELVEQRDTRGGRFPVLVDSVAFAFSIPGRLIEDSGI